VFAAGNVLQGAETADVAALGGRGAAVAAARHLEAPGFWAVPRVPVRCSPPLRWIVPNVVSPGGEPGPRRGFRLRASEFLRRPRLELHQDGRPLWAGRVHRLQPGRSTRLPEDWVSAVDPAGGPVEVHIRP
jgi:hypothetical protein